MHKLVKRISAVLGAVVLGAGAAAAAGVTGAAADPAAAQTSFQMVRSGAAVAANCLPGATAKVSIRSQGPVEVMTVTANHLPASKEFDLFVIQVPNAPFGVSWYQGDLETDGRGHAQGTFIGRFSVETFAVAPDVAPAPQVHNSKPFPDAATNPKFGPVHTYHLGLWFNSPNDAKAAGCPNTTTPFNGDHTAGVQALSTRQFHDDQGPLRRITP